MTSAGEPLSPLASLVGVGLSSEEQTVKQIPYSWFGQFFKQSECAVKFDAGGLTLTSLNQNRFFTINPASTNPHSVGKAVKNTVENNDNEIDNDRETALQFNWQQLDRPSAFHWSFFGYLLNFKAGKQTYCVPFLSYRAKSQFSDDMAVFWAKANQDRLCKLVSRIEHAISSEYPRQSRVNQINARVAREYARWFPWSRERSLNLSEELRAALTKLKQFKAWTSQDIANTCEQYIQRQLLQYKIFFDSVESNPLTDKQRRACVIDDNNNLLLAGAGTGKTSVMVGRAGYLIKSGQAIADDILLLAYGKVAAKELDERIQLKLGPLLTSNKDDQALGATGVRDIRASTFHSLGMHIITEVEGVRPKLSAWANDEKAKNNWVNDTLASLVKDKRYCKRLLTFFSDHFHIEMSSFYFENEKDQSDYLSANEIQTYNGEKVKRFPERQIANWLYRQGIEYRYDALYQHKQSDKGTRPYLSNFYLPQYDLYIDYFDIDETGAVPLFIDNDSYHDSIDRRRKLHQDNQTQYVELYYHQHSQGQLLKHLSKALTKCKVKRAPVDDEALLAKLRELGVIDKLVKLFSQAISLYKGSCLDDSALAERLSMSANQVQTDAAFTLLKPMIKAYRAHLKSSGEIDFEDMIAKAIQYLDQGRFVSPWRYIMVDEFQDISEPRARLIRALRDSTYRVSKEKPAEDQKSAGSSKDKTKATSPVKSTRSASLFCVGDDWQAIYRFSGADVQLTTEFEHYFGPVTKTHLDLTFRFNSRIGDVATRFVTQNPMQLKKSVESFTKGNKSSVSIVKGKSANKQADETNINESKREKSALTDTLDSIAGLLTKSKRETDVKPTVYLLARYWFLLPDSQALLKLNQHYSSFTIECQSFHAAKGKEADYVIITGLTTGMHGFPSQRSTPPVLEALLPEEEDFKFAEERRLFYVALTRAKHKVYLLAGKNNVSPFVDEIAQLCRTRR
ncbi:UvrD-helicase domain-containing protein [Shewanella canadensis]|nr:UvrD-helicase domain-containing protein [Shewanella canadensis]